MKLMSEFLLIPPIEKNRIVKCIVTWKANGPEKLPEPTMAKDLKCPDCGSTNAYWNPPWDAWVCMEKCCSGKGINYEKEREGYLSTSKSVPAKPIKRCIEGVPNALESSNLGSSVHNPEFKKEWLEWAKKRQNNLLFSGPSGTGKSYAACAILKEVADQTSVSLKFINISDLYLDWKVAVQENEDVDLLLKLIAVDLLVIDDIGQRTPTESFLEFLYLLVTKRLDLLKPFIITTNLSYKEMQEKLGQALTSRITCAKVYKFEGKDLRVNLW